MLPCPRSVSYVVTVEVFGAVLRVVAEETESNDRWKGEFSSQCKRCTAIDTPMRDLTALYTDIEEITQKAGNFKKFPVFVRMLCSALSRESDSVFVDLLTYGDLEMLKAKKTGASVSASTASLPSRNQSKRYIILTYSGEFDRVHFPIPLAFEEEPDAASLQRTIARLKRSLLDKTRAELDLSARDERCVSAQRIRRLMLDGLRFLFTFSNPTASQLRQENMELRHRLRKFEGRSLPSGTGPAAAVSAAASQQNGELLLAYSKLKRQYELTKKELHAATMAYDRLRTESAKEITRLKIQVAGDSTPKAQAMDNIELARKLRAQCVQLKKDLETERAEHKRCIVRHQRELANLRHASSTYPKRGSSTPTPTGSSSRKPSPSSGLPPRPSSAGGSRSSTGSMTRRSTTSPTPTRRQTPSSSRDTRDTKITRRSSSPLYGRSSHSSAVGSPASRGGAHDRYARSASRSPSPITERPAWNSGSGNRRKAAGYESGYSSAASQSSAGSRRSRGSTRSTGQNSVASSRSGRSGTSERKTKKKATRKPMYSDDSDVPSVKSDGRKKKSTRKSKEKRKEKEPKVPKHRDVLDIDILEDEVRRSKTSLGEPLVVRSPPRDSTRRSRDAEGEQMRLSRDHLRASGDSISRKEHSNTMVSVRRSDDSRRSVRTVEAEKEMRSSRETHRDKGIYTSTSLQDGVLGPSLYGTQRLDPDSFPVSKASNPENRDSYYALNEDHYNDDEEAMRRAFDGLSMAKRNIEPTANSSRVSSEQLRRSHDFEGSNFMRRSLEENVSDIDRGGSVASKPVVITRAGPPRGDARKENPPANNQSPPSDSEEDGGGSGGENDISEIDKRIKALQSFLDKARCVSIFFLNCVLLIRALIISLLFFI